VKEQETPMRTYFTLETGGIPHIQKTESGKYFSIMSLMLAYNRFMGRILVAGT
jgi:hypothetical protein